MGVGACQRAGGSGLQRTGGHGVGRGHDTHHTQRGHARFSRPQRAADSGVSALGGADRLGMAVQQIQQAIALVMQLINQLGLSGGGALSLPQTPAPASTYGAGGAPVSAGGPTVGAGALGGTFLQPGSLQVGVNWEGLDEIGATGRTPDMVRKFDSFDNAAVSAKEKQLVAQGAMLFKSLKPRQGGNSIPWAEVASGRYDAFLAEYLQNLKRDGGQNVILAFNHEPDGKQNADKGTPAEFVAAWRHIHNLADRLGVSRAAGGNVEFAWTMVGWGFKVDRVGPYYPGDQYVDYVGTDPYDNSKSGTRQSFADSVSSTLEWMDKNGINKPVIVGETGSESGQSADRSGSQAAWVQQMMSDLRNNPALQRVVAVNYWSNQVPGAGHTNFNLDPTAAQTLARFM